MPRQPRKFVCLGNARQSRPVRRAERAGAAHVDIESAVSRCRLDIERLSGGL